MIPGISGNDALISNLESIISSGRIPHSFLIEGGSFEERKAVANYIAGAVVCESDEKPCGNCRQCKLCENGSNVDISYIGLEDGKKNILVSQIRKLRADAFIKPHSAQKRVFIIENADLMNEQSQNALLKILEEPPASVVFILLTPSRALSLVTIISRCSILKLSDKENNNDEELFSVAENILNLLFDFKEYEALKILSSFEKDRLKSEKLLRAIQKNCAETMKSGNISNYRAKALSKIYDQCEEYISLIRTNINMPLLFSAAICRFRSFLD